MISDFLFWWYLHYYCGMCFSIVIEIGGRLWERQCETDGNWSYRWQRFLVPSSYTCASVCILTSSYIVWGREAEFCLPGIPWRLPRTSVEVGGRPQLLSRLKSKISILWRLQIFCFFGCDKQGCFPLILNKSITESGLLWQIERAHLT